MSTYSASAHIAAPPERVWSVLADVVRWPEWLPTMSSVQALDAAALTIGGRYRITQPKLRPAIWSVVSLEPQRGFAWQSRSPGLRSLATHVVRPMSGASVEVTLQVSFAGPMGWLAAALAGRLTRRYLALEVASLKQRVEAGPTGP